MRFIPTRVHGVMDYLVGILLIAAPWLFQFSGQETARWTVVIIGAGTLVYSALTDYEMGLASVLSMPVHLGMDNVAGLVLIVSPWLLGFAHVVWGPHVVIGIVEVLTALTTERTPATQSASFET